MTEIVYLTAGIILGWCFRWQRDKKYFDLMKEELKKLSELINKL